MTDKPQELELTQEQAITLYETEWWKDVTDKEIVELQLFTKRLCMPFDIFQIAVGKVLGRPVWTHEFGTAGALKDEFLGKKSAPTFQQIMNIIPIEKRILVIVQ